MSLRISLENGDSLGLEGIILTVSEHPLNREERTKVLKIWRFLLQYWLLDSCTSSGDWQEGLTSPFISPTSFPDFIPDEVTHNSSQGPGHLGHLCH